MSEVQYVKEFMEAQMEKERVAVSLYVYEEVEGQGTRSNREDYDERLAELNTDEAYMSGNQEVAEVKASKLTVKESPVNVHPSVKPSPVIQDSTKILNFLT